jgi:predicted phosphoadenosine phosphosulfate sulfurtransferase
MYQAGVPLRYMRICEPFGPEQRQGLWLYHVLEPERWAAMCQRVSGACGGGIYAGRITSSTGIASWRNPTSYLEELRPVFTRQHAGKNGRTLPE